MENAQIRYEGNLRLASLHADGWPDDIDEFYSRCLNALDGQHARAYGPRRLLFSFPPDDEGPRKWPCQIGTAITGMARVKDGLFVEDYHNLHSLRMAHNGPIKNVHTTYQNLANRAQALGTRLRPYWEFCLHRQALSDGSLHPLCEVVVYVDR